MFSRLIHAWRAWKGSKGIALLAIAALAVGIGSTTAIYTVIQAVLLNPLPWADPERYHLVYGASRAVPRASYSYFEVEYITSRVRTVEAFGCSFSGSYNVTFNGSPLHLNGTQVSPVMMQVLGTQPALGRWFNNPDQEPGGARGLVLSHSLWQRFGSDPRIIGKTVNMTGGAFATPGTYTITGVMPPAFRYPVWEKPDFWVPIIGEGDQKTRREASRYLICMAKRKSGVSLQQMQDDLNDVHARLANEYPSPRGPDAARVDGVLERVVEDIRPTLLLLLGAALALLLISCANTGSLLLARSVARARETAVRAAMGASLRQLGAEYFAEGLLVSAAAAAAGVLMSYAVVRAVLRLAADDIPRADQIGLDGRVLLFTLGIAIVSTALFSLAPLWQARRIAPRDALNEGVRATAGARSRGLFRVFVISEIALAAGLVAVGGVLVERLGNLYRVQPGFDPNQLLTLNMIATSFANEQALTDYETRLLEAVQAIPGVESAGFTLTLPLTGPLNGTSLWIDGRQDTELGGMSLMFVSPDYFRAMRTPLLEGRFFTNADRREAVSAMILNQAAARRLFPQGGAVGTIIRSSSWKEPDVKFRIVGVVGDARNVTLSQPSRPEAYVSYRTLSFPDMAWAIRSPLDSATLVREVRAAAARVNPEQAIFNERPMTEIIVSSVTTQRLQSFMVSFFAGSALLLAILGIYGVVAYSVRQRTVELGTRMALGATSGNVIGLVMGDGLKMAAAGMIAGVAAILALGQLLRSSGLGIDALSAPPLLIAAIIVLLLSALACLIPAWRAALLSPMVAIRSDAGISWAQTRSAYRRLTAQLSGLMARPEREADAAELLAAAVDASARAETFSEAIRLSLATLRELLSAESAALMVQRAPGEIYRCIAAAPGGIRRDWSLPADVPVFGRLRHYSSALPLSSEDLDAWNRWARAEAPEHLGGIETLQSMGAALAAPVSVRSKITGVLILGRPTNRAGYGERERQAFYSAGAQFALLIENGRLTERVVEQERLKRELQMAAEVQKRLFPEKSPETATVHCAGVCVPARGVGGDYYDFLDLGHGNIGIALADVAGKGIAAALIMSVVQASLRSLAETNVGSLAELAARMNRLLHRSTGTSSYATFFYGQFDESAMQLRYVNAGHNPPYVLRARDGSIEELAAGGTIIGMFAESRYEEAAIGLQSGDVMIAFTDGVPEALNPQEEEFGEERLKATLRRHSHLPVDQMAAQILQEVQAWVSHAPQHDDLTFVLMKVR